jgi:hypothetical protein
LIDPEQNSRFGAYRAQAGDATLGVALPAVAFCAYERSLNSCLSLPASRCWGSASSTMARAALARSEKRSEACHLSLRSILANRRLRDARSEKGRGDARQVICLRALNAEVLDRARRSETRHQGSRRRHHDLGYIDLEQWTLQPSTIRSARDCHPGLRCVPFLGTFCS